MTGYATARPVSFTEIPVIDLQPIAGGPAGLAAVAAAIRRAATEIGFFYVANHGVPTSVIDAAYAASQHFFAQPEAVKQRAKINTRHRGFLKVGEAKMYDGARPDLKESYIFGLDLPEDDPDVRAGKKLMGPNVWPVDLPEMKQALDRYAAAIDGVGRQLLRAIAVALELPESFFVERYRKPLARGSIIYYPPQPPDLGADQFGVSAHTDYGCLTLLSQDANGGLQVRNRAGEWIAAPPLAGTFVINIGDLLARWTNDLFTSTPHRVVNASGRPRYSIAVFYDPDYDTRIEGLPGCGPSAYPPVSCGDYIVGRFDRAFAYRK